MKETSLNLKIENISYSTKNDFRLKNISIEFEAGNIYSIIGHNGAGKSTFLKILSKIIKNYCGNILINTENFNNLNDGYFQKYFGVLLQELNRPENFDVYSFLELYLNTNEHSKKNNHEKINLFINSLKEFSMENHLYKKITQLSGGEWKKIQICALFLTQKKILILDEPDGDLDISSQKKLSYLLKLKSHQKNTLTILATHNFDFIKRLESSTIVMEHGKIVHNCLYDEYEIKKIQNKIHLY